MGDFTIEISPKKIHFDLFGGIEISETVLVAYCVTAIIIVLALLFRYLYLKRFTDKPKGLQNIIEWCVESINKFSKSYMNEKGKTIAAYVFALTFFLIMSGLVELIGFRAPATDINFTSAIALMSFVLIITYGVRYKGAIGYLKSFGQPKGFVAPFRILSELSLPVSLACRMFGNMISGLIIMNLLYSVMGYFAVGIPAILSIYFNLFHVLMQTYVFLTLTLSFVNEAVE